ncbi:hypothetical protein IT411_00775 [Candidatus Peregrinibacteria bacterium]|nr:hypothetical protein [Candidatus Peregrinibacteria bacterium]
MIGVSQKGSDINAARLDIVVEDGGKTLSTMYVDFVGYGGFKVVVTKANGGNPKIFTCFSSSREATFKEALEVSDAPEQDRSEIKEKIEEFLVPFIGPDPQKQVPVVGA